MKFKYIYRFKAIPIKIPAGCLSEGRGNYKLILRHIYVLYIYINIYLHIHECKEPGIAKTILKKNKATRISRVIKKLQ